MKRKLTIAVTAILAVAALPAQNVVDAARFGSFGINGTARYRSMAGAFGALGGDPSCMNDNPAGLAIYRSTNLFTFTPHLNLSNATTYGSEKETEKTSNFAMSNMSAIFSFRDLGSDNIVNFTMGIGFERKYENHSKYNVVLDYCDGSFSNYLKNQANTYIDHNIYVSDPFDWETSDAPILSLLGNDCYAFERVNQGSNYVKDPILDTPYTNHRLTSPYDDRDVFQTMYVDEQTRLDQYSISGALNFNDVFYVGATINILDFRSIIRTQFDEQYSYNYDKSYILFDNDLETKGTGIGFNLGVLWMPIDNWRIGAAIHTPTWSDLDENNYGWMTTDDDEFDTETGTWYNGNWKYSFDTPWEYQLSSAYIIGTRGLISVEYDLRDFSSMRYRESSQYWIDGGDNYFNNYNTAIKDYLKAQHTIKVGGEFRINPKWSVRAGYAYVTSPWVETARRGWLNVYDNAGNPIDSEVNWDNYSISYGSDTNIQNIVYYSSTKPNYQTQDDQYYITLGAGWRGKQWYVDGAFMYHKTNFKAAAYPADFSSCEPVDVCRNEKTFDMTVGYRF